MKIEIYYDIACPFCYIGKTRLNNVINELNLNDKVEIVYKSYLLNPNTPLDVSSSYYDYYSKSNNISKILTKQHANLIAAIAKKENLNYNYEILQVTNTFKAHTLIKWAKEKGLEEILINRLLKAYFNEGYHLSNNQDLLKILKTLNLTVNNLDNIINDERYINMVNKDLDDARVNSVPGVPLFVFDNNYTLRGAQSKESFKEVILSLLSGNNNFTLDDDGNYCSDDGCLI